MSETDKVFQKINEREEASNHVVVSLMLFIGLSSFLFFHALYSIYDYAFDDSIPLVVCPRSFDLDSPVILDTINYNPKHQDKWVKGFIRRFTTYQFPRNKSETAKFFKYIENHTKGGLNVKYKRYNGDIEEIGKQVGMGFYYRFYPKNSQDILIRKTNKPWQWVVEIEGYFVKTLGMKRVRSIKTIRYLVEAGKPTIHNPEGLYVLESNVDQVEDFVSGRTKDE